jgi:bifunctional DNase/RNase
MVEMQLHAVRVELPTNNPVVLLQEVGGARRTLPIFIGPPEATAIAFALQGVTTQRPMTHDLLRDILVALGVTVERVVITELRDGTFYAELHLRNGGRTEVISSRPSDAIALAARMGSPIFCDDDLLDAEGMVLPTDDGADEAEDDGDPEEIVDQFKHFIDNIRPEDFTS